MLAFGLIGLVILAVWAWQIKGPTILLLLGLASLLVGSLLGLLFGVPERLENGSPNQGHKLGFRSTNNLKQISDWLTKIIVGVTLTQFDDIMSYMSQAASLAASSFPGSPEWARSAGFSAMFLHGTAGFWFGYLWAAAHLPGILEDAESVPSEVADLEELGLAQEQFPSRAARQEVAATEESEIRPGDIPDDPWKGVFGGPAAKVVNGWTLSATAEPLSSDWFRVRIKCRKDTPSHGSASVKFFLHPTFPRPIQEVQVDDKGGAELTLAAWGAFTVGVLTSDGTKLELDLATIDAPEVFRTR